MDSAGILGASRPSAWRTYAVSVPITALPTPVLVSPADKQVLTNKPIKVTLAWQAVPGAKEYFVELEQDGIESQQVSGLSATFAVTSATGNWRVTAWGGPGTHSYSKPSAWRTYSVFPFTPKPIVPPKNVGGGGVVDPGKHVQTQV